MPRNLVSGAAYPTNFRGQVIRLAEITTRKVSDNTIVTHYFATEETIYAGNLYKPWLVMDEPVHRFRSLQVPQSGIKLQNADGTLETLLAVQKWEGATVKILDFFPDVSDIGEGRPDAVELIRGVLGERQADEALASWPVVPAWDPATVEAPRRPFSRACTWRFKGNECGYVDGVDPNDPGTGLPFVTCPKDVTACTARGRAHRFPGFIHISRELVQVYPSSEAARGGAGGSSQRGGGAGRAARVL